MTNKDIAENFSICAFDTSSEAESFCAEVIARGGSIVETFTPCKIENPDFKPVRTKHGSAIFAVSLLTFVGSLFFIYWTSALAYPVETGGKPLFSLVFSLPVLFEFTVLCSAAAVMLLFLTRKKRYDVSIEEIIDLNSIDTNKFTIIYYCPKH